MVWQHSRQTYCRLRHSIKKVVRGAECIAAILKAPALDDRIASAFDKNITVKAVADVLTEAEAALAIATETAEKAGAKALSPALTSKRVADATRPFPSCKSAARPSCPPSKDHAATVRFPAHRPDRCLQAT